MTRFVKAWKSWAAATTILWMAARQALFGSQRRDSEEARFSATRSALPLIWAVGASVLVLACVPSTAFAGQRSSLHAHLGTTQIGNKPAHHSTGTTAHSQAARIDPPRCGRAGRTIHVNGDLLAPGSGYGTPGGSCSVRALQRRLAETGYAPGPIDGRSGATREPMACWWMASPGRTRWDRSWRGPVSLTRVPGMRSTGPARCGRSSAAWHGLACTPDRSMACMARSPSKRSGGSSRHMDCRSTASPVRRRSLTCRTMRPRVRVRLSTRWASPPGLLPHLTRRATESQHRPPGRRQASRSRRHSADPGTGQGSEPSC